MNARTSILAVGVALALVGPAAASARAITNQQGETYVISKHSGKAATSLNVTNFRTEHSAHQGVVIKTKTSSTGSSGIYVTPIVTASSNNTPGPAVPSSTYANPTTSDNTDPGDSC